MSNMQFLYFAGLALAAVSPAAAQTEDTAMVAAPCAAAPAVDSVANRARDWPDLCHYAAANAAVTTRPHVVFIGDSITEGWKTGDPAMFSADVLDRGISGQTSQQMLVRFYADVIMLRPAIVHIMAGTNDVAGNGGPTSEAAFHNNMSAMADLARAHHIRVVIGAIPPAVRFWWAPNLRPAAQIAALNAWLQGYARQHGDQFVDYWKLMATSHGAMRADLSSDGVHPNPAGYAAMRPLALATIR